MKRLPTGTVTFLFTDIEASTALLQRLGDRRYAEVLSDHQRLLRDAFGRGNGQEIDTQGDAFLVAFARAREALAVAVAAQLALVRHPWPDGAALRVRMALHSGEPVTAIDRYVGLDVHRAARICGAGHGGQILVSDAVIGLAASELPPGVSLRDLGTHRLKDLQESEHIFQVVHPDLPSDFPRLRSLDAPRNNLPRQLTSFIGREKEIAENKRLLSTARLVTLTGTGGAGKTRLGLQVAADLLDQYPEGAWFVELAPLSDPALVPRAVSTALDVPEQPGRQLLETLAHFLPTKHLLLVLDNCEHVLSACRDLADTLLRACPHLHILATSREALGVDGEVTYRVPSLQLPDPHRVPPLAALAEYEAIRLFAERAALGQPGFALTANNAAAVAQICHRLDGIPLAIEFAAARVKVLAVEQIAARLDDRFRLLTAGARKTLPRHQTLRAAMDWSYDLLSEDERTVLRWLSVFAGGWTLEAAETVCAGDGVEASGILDLLTQLVDKSLVVAETRGGEARYRLLETVRQYGLDRLMESAQAVSARRRHRDWYLRLVERADAELRGPEQIVWLERLDTEIDNLRAALEWSRTEPDGTVTALRLAGALHWFWFIRGQWSEGRGWLQDALARGSDAPPAVRTKALWGAAYLAWGQADTPRAIALSEQGLALSRASGDKEGIARFLVHLGMAALRQGDAGQAAALCGEGLSLCRELGNKWLISWTLTQAGAVAINQGDHGRAAALDEECLALARETGDKYRIAFALRSGGMRALLEGDSRQAAARLTESLVLCREVGDRRVTGENLEGLAGVAYASGHYEQAARLLAACDSLHEATGYYRSTLQYRIRHEQNITAMRAALGETGFQTAWAEGRAMTLEQAIEYALAGQSG